MSLGPFADDELSQQPAAKIAAVKAARVTTKAPASKTKPATTRATRTRA